MTTDRGRVRDHNEDFIAQLEPTSSEDEEANGWVYIVADGVGGADAGELASQYSATQTITHYKNLSDQEHFGQRLVKSMQFANTDLRTLVAEKYDGRRMATTMVATVIADGRAYIANVGDSRGYHWRASSLRQITKDQSLVAKLLEEGAITEDEAARHPHRNVILFSIGSEKTPQIDLFEVALTIGDKIFLCSDGLTRHVSDEEISSILEAGDIQQAAQQLVEMANDRGGQDNISVAIIDYGVKPAGEGSTTYKTKVAMPADSGSNSESPPNKAFLIPYTIFLSVVEVALILLAWLLLRV